MARREARHPERLSDFASALIDQVAFGAPGVVQIAGREQQLIDFYGGARSDRGTSANLIRAVSKSRTIYGKLAWNASNAAFGALYPYTGY